MEEKKEPEKKPPIDIEKWSLEDILNGLRKISLKSWFLITTVITSTAGILGLYKSHQTADAHVNNDLSNSTLIGRYTEEDIPHESFVYGHFLVKSIGSSLIIYYDPNPSKLLKANEESTNEVFYISKKDTFSLGIYTANWGFEEQKRSVSMVEMRESGGIHRIGLEELSQKLISKDQKTMNEFYGFKNKLEQQYFWAVFQISIADGGKVNREMWFDPRKETLEKTTFIKIKN